MNAKTALHIPFFSRNAPKSWKSYAVICRRRNHLADFRPSRLTGFCWSLFKRCLPLRPTRQQRPLLAPMNGRRRQRWPIREMCRLLRPMRERHLQLRPIRKRCRLLGTLRERRWKLRPIRGRCEFLRPVRQRRRYYWSIRNRRRWMTSMRARRRQRPPPQSTLSTARDICLLYTSPSPRDGLLSRMPSSA